MSDNKPIAKFKAAGIHGALWQNKMKLKNGQEVDTLSLTLERRYKDKDDNWKSSSSFRMNDLPKIIYVATKAYDFMMSQGANTSVTEEAVI